MSLTPALTTLLRRIDRFTLDTLGGTPPFRRDREPMVRALEDPGTLARSARRTSRADLDDSDMDGAVAG